MAKDGDKPNLDYADRNVGQDNFDNIVKKDREGVADRLRDRENQAGELPAKNKSDLDTGALENANWNYGGKNTLGGSKAGGGLKTRFFNRRNKIVLSVLGALIGGSIGIFGPGIVGTLGIVHFEETINKHFGSGLQSIVEKRVNRIWYKQINESNRTPGVKGICGKNVSVACRYSGISNRAIRNIEKRTGVKIEVDENKLTFPGRKVIKSITMPSGEVLDAAEFANRLKNGDVELRRVMRTAMKPALAIWTNAKMKTLFKKLKIDKLGGFIKEKTVDKVKEKIKQRQNGVSVELDADVEAHKAREGEELDSKQAKQNNLASQFSEQLKNGEIGGQPIAEGITAANALDAASSAAKGVASAAMRSVSIVGSADTACTALNTLSMIGYIGKIAGSEQLIHFAMTFLSSVSGLKFGVATPAGGQAIGELLFTKDPETGKNAFETFAWQMISGGWGDPTETMTYRSGGGLPGNLKQIADFFANLVSVGNPGAVRSTCGFIQNPITRVASVAIGIVATVISIGAFPTAQAVGNLVISGALGIITSYLIPIAAKTLAGELVTPGIVGGSASSAAISGAGAAFGQNNNAQGTSVQTKPEAVLFNDNVVRPYLAEVAEDERLAANPIDIFNPYSFTGSIASGLVPYLTHSSLVANFTSVGSLALNPFQVLTPKVSAAEESRYYEVCQDQDYLELNIAADPFCNPVYGLDEISLDEDPDVVIEYMYDSGQVDAEGNAKDKYAEFLENCTERIEPIGFKNEDTEDFIRSTDCMKSAGVYDRMFYIYTVDDSVYQMQQCLMDEEDSACYIEDGSGTNTPDFTDAGQCPAGTNIVPGITTGWDRTGKESGIALCAIPNTEMSQIPHWKDKQFQGTSAAGVTEISVNSEAAASLLQATTRAKQDGVKLSASIGYRSLYEQCSIYIRNHSRPSQCPSWIKPISGNWNTTTLFSNHMMGKSIDFYQESENWMRKCMKQNLDGTNDNRCYGFYDDVFQSQNWDSAHFTYKPV